MAIVSAAKLEWPPNTVGLRIIDREGREVFERHRVEGGQRRAESSHPARTSKQILVDSLDNFTAAAARLWRRLTPAIARKTGRPVGLDTSTWMATDANLTAEGNPIASSHRPSSDIDSLDELMSLVPGAMTRPVRTPKRLQHWRRHAEARKVR